MNRNITNTSLDLIPPKQRPAFKALQRAWEHEEITEVVFCIKAANLLDCTPGEVRDMIDNFEV